MRYCTLSVLLLCFFIELNGQQLPQPQLIEWHSRYRVEQMMFSGDGNYLLTKGDDEAIIITDLRRRVPLFRLSPLAEKLVQAHPAANLFTTASSGSEQALFRTRRIPSGEVVHQLQLPAFVNNCQLARVGYRGYDAATGKYTATYQSGNEYTIATFDTSGSLTDSFTLQTSTYINTVLHMGNQSFIAAGSGLYEKNGQTANILLQPQGSNEQFANMQRKGDTLILLSNEHVWWYSITRKTVVRKTNISSFFSQSINSPSVASLTQYQHPFAVDADGAVWLTNTSMAEGTDAVVKRPYSVAKVSQRISYPLMSDHLHSRSRIKTEEVLAFDANNQLMAILEKSNRVVIFHTTHGSLFALDRSHQQIDNFWFTNVPGRLLVQTEKMSAAGAGYLIHLGNGRMQTIGTFDELIYQNPTYKTSVDKQYRLQGNQEQLYIPSGGNYIAAPYLLKGKDAYLRFPYKELLNVRLPDGSNITLSETGNLEAKGGNGERSRRLQLFGLNHLGYGGIDGNVYTHPKTEKTPFTKNHVLDRYTYDSAAGILALYFGENYTSHMRWLVHVVDLRNFQLLGSYLDENITILTASRQFVNRFGIFSIGSNEVVLRFEGQALQARQFTPARNGQHLFMYVPGYTRKDQLLALNLATRQLTQLGEQYGIEKMSTDPHSNLLYTLGQDNSIMIWNTEALLGTLVVSGKQDFKQLAEVDGSYLFLSSTGHYMGENKYYKLLKLQQGNTSYSINEVDALYNRPDIVLEQLPYSNQDVLAPIRQMARKRAERFSLLLNERDARIANWSAFPFYAADPAQSLTISLPPNSGAEGVMVYVNGTAIWPSPRKITASTTELKADVKLVDRVNHVRACMVLPGGKETAGDYLYIDGEAANDARLYLIGIGVSQYRESQRNLEYAVKDVNDLMNYFQTTGTYASKIIRRYADKQVTKAVLDSITQLLQTAREQDVVLCYFAGHGLLDKQNDYFLATHDLNFEDPAGNGIDIRRLNSVIAAAAARKKMIFIDACHSGLIDDLASASDSVAPVEQQEDVVSRGLNIKGKKQNASAVRYQFQQFSQGTGVDILAAAAGNEFALESGSIRNGVFTYSILQAFKSGEADLNNDKQLTLSELQHYVAEVTRQLTKGAQRPSFRQNNLFQDIVLLKTADSYLSRFIAAAKDDHVPTLKLLLENNEVTVDQPDADGFTAIHYAAREGSLQAAKYLIGQSASVQLKTPFGFTPLYLAAYNDHYRLAFLLLVNGADVAQDIPQHFMQNITGKNHAPTLQVIRQYPQLLQQQNQFMEVAQALLNGNTLRADSLISTNKINLNNHLLIEGIPLLVAAIFGEKPEALTWCLQRGADVNLPSLDDGYTPLMYAASQGATALVQLLLQHGADKTRKDSRGKTAADYARQFGHPDIATLLQ